MENMVYNEKNLYPKGSIMFSAAKLPNRKVPKYLTRLAVGSCVASTVRRIVEKITEYEEMDRKDQIVVRIGAFGLGGAASTAAGKYTDEAIDELYEIFEEAFPAAEVINDEGVIIIDADQ